MNKFNEEEYEVNDNIDIQLAENQTIEEIDADQTSSYEEKRNLLKKTKIVKQTWSIQEIYQKIKSGRLKLSPDYQRNEIWEKDKKTAFIESLYMGIIVPPIYVVEIPGNDFLEDSTYEVVDGKQRLTAIEQFLINKLVLLKKSLEYYQDWFGGKLYSEIRDNYGELTSEMLSSVLDIYVITANSPEFTKYDIFSRLNKGAEKLKVNEIRKAIYHSSLLEYIDGFVKSYTDAEDKSRVAYYEDVFSKNDIKRYEDYGKFYSSIAFFVQSDVENGLVKDYNSRPRDMINMVLQKIQNRELNIPFELVCEILEYTLSTKYEYRNIDGIDYIINACVPYLNVDKIKLLEKMEDIVHDETIIQSLKKSPATTSNVNLRLKRINEIIK